MSATPDGRCKGEALADGTMSPMRGRDTRGVIASLKIEKKKRAAEAEAAKQAEIDRHDKMLLQTYITVADIEDLRNRRLELLESSRLLRLHREWQEERHQQERRAVHVRSISVITDPVKRIIVRCIGCAQPWSR